MKRQKFRDQKDIVQGFSHIPCMQLNLANPRHYIISLTSLGTNLETPSISKCSPGINGTTGRTGNPQNHRTQKLLYPWVLI